MAGIADQRTTDRSAAGVELADFPTDDDALARAAALRSDQHGVEIWQFARVVGRLTPKDLASALNHQ